MAVSIIVTIVVIIALFLYIVSIYNRLVALKNRFQNAFAQIEVQLKRRYDLIPNLIETVKGYMEHERSTLDAVIKARNTAMSALGTAANNPASSSAMAELASAEGALTSALGKLNVVVEAYPELKADSSVEQLQEELITTENKVAFARQAFNDAVTNYNTYKQGFPPIIFAPSFGHPDDATLLEFEDSEVIQSAPKVSF